MLGAEPEDDQLPTADAAGGPCVPALDLSAAKPPGAEAESVCVQITTPRGGTAHVSAAPGVAPKSVALPDGSMLVLEPGSLQCIGPWGSSSSIAPLPEYGAARSTPRAPLGSMSVACTMLQPKKWFWMLARWEQLELRVEGFEISWSTSAGALAGTLKLGTGLIEIERAEKGTPRTADCFADPGRAARVAGAQQLAALCGDEYVATREIDGTVGKDHCLVLRKPDSSIEHLRDAARWFDPEGVAAEKNAARAFVFAFESAAERDACEALLRGNMRHYEISDEFLAAVASECRERLNFSGGALDAELDMLPYLDQLFSARALAPTLAGHDT